MIGKTENTMRKLMFKVVKWMIRRYFHEGLSPIFGTNEAEGTIIAWEWRFLDEAYERKTRS